MAQGENNASPVDLITVHGTFAGDDADEGEKWWQRGSDFLHKLQLCIANPLHVAPFHWTGANSETDRRKAGVQLWRKVKDADALPIILGHSHGGSVTIQALAQSIIERGEKAEQEPVRGFVSIATPMFRFRTNRNPFGRFNIWGRVLLVAAIGILIGAVSAFTSGYRFLGGRDRDIPLSEGLMFVPWSAVALGVGIIFALWLFTRRNLKRASLFRENRVFAVFRRIATSLSHTQDEAINALRRGLDASPKLVTTRSLFAPLFSLLAFAAVTLDFGLEAVSNFSTDQYLYTERNEGSRTSFASVFFMDNDQAALQFADARESRRGWLYQVLYRRDAIAQADLAAVPLASLWEAPGAEEVVDRAPWLLDIKASLSEGAGFAMVRPRDEVKLRKTFARVLSNAAAVGKDAYVELARPCPAIGCFGPPTDDELVEARIDALTYHSLFSRFQQRLVEPAGWGYTAPEAVAQAERDGLLAEASFPPGIVTVLRLDEVAYAGLLENGSILPRGTRLETGYHASQVIFSCEIDGFIDPSPLCDLVYGEDKAPLFDQVDGVIFWPALWLVQSMPDEIKGFLENGLVRGDYESQSALINISTRLILMTIIAAIAAGLISVILKPFLNGFVVGTLKTNAFGDDGYGETLVDVAPGIDFDVDLPGNLPQNVEDEMIANSLADAPEALQRLRTLLSGGDFGQLGEAGDPIAAATKFEKSELIHNAYFQSDLFTKYLAALLITKFGLRPTRDFIEDEDGSAFLEMFQPGALSDA